MSEGSKLVAGIDEAGRGAIIGPLVVAGVLMKEDRLGELNKMGVRDSKLLSPSGRARLYPSIQQVADKVLVWKVGPEEVDEYVLRGSKYRKLNYLEAIAMGRVIGQLEADLVYVDSPDVSPERFKSNIEQAVNKRAEIIAVHHADRIYPIVGAASIVAKVERDSEISRIREEYGGFGSGYPSDARTIKFLEGWLKTHKDFPPFARRSWKTWRRLGYENVGESPLPSGGG